MKIMVIAGNGSGLERELALMDSFGVGYHLSAINAATRRVAPREALYLTTAHPDVFRDEPGSHKLVGPCAPADVVWTSPWYTCGGSAMYSTLFALDLGYDRIVLCGCPLDSETHRYLFEQEKCWFERNRIVFRSRVRSTSGNTRLLLGAPTAEWLSS